MKILSDNETNGYDSEGEVMCKDLCLLEEYEVKLEHLQNALAEGENSGDCSSSVDAIWLEVQSAS